MLRRYFDIHLFHIDHNPSCSPPTILHNHYCFQILLGITVVPREIEDNREIKLNVYGKRKTSDSSWQFLKIEKQLKTILMDKKLRETTKLCVEIMNSKQQVKEKLGHVVQIRVWRLT